MKFMRFFIVVVLIFLCFKVNAQAIAFQGFECSNLANADDPTPTSDSIESRFKVSEILNDGFYRLILTGGLPRFVNDDQQVCIDSDTAIGFIGTSETVNTGGLPLRHDSIDATAYFNGNNLVIVVSSIYTDLSQSRGTFSSFRTSRIQPVTNTLFFNYDQQDGAFILKNIIHNKGLVLTSGSTGSLTPFNETIVPSLDETGLLEPPKILTPSSAIVYQFEP